MNIDQKYMKRAIALGKNALGLAAPNPMVGAVVVYKDTIIGEGYTSAYGGPHAEVNAINAVQDKALLQKATLYVTLEPCSHYGKTPPCADLIVAHKIPKVVIGLQDPHQKVAGKGIAKLKDAGATVVVGCLEKACREHHKRFLAYQEKKRPYVLLKWAESADGFLAPTQNKRAIDPQPYWVTNVYSRQLVHQWRSQEQAILVGTQTAILDNPALDVRDWTGTNPLRLVLDQHLKIDPKAKIFNAVAPTIVFTAQEAPQHLGNKVCFEKIDFSTNLASQICKVLYDQEVTSLIVEGGAQTLNTFIKEDLWDEARIFKGNKYFYDGVTAPKIKGSLVTTTPIKEDQLKIWKHD